VKYGAMPMPKKKGEKPEAGDDLAALDAELFGEEPEMGEDEMAEEPSELEAVPDELLLAEVKKRGLSVGKAKSMEEESEEPELA